MLRGCLLTVQLVRLRAAWLTNDSPNSDFKCSSKKSKNTRTFKLRGMKRGTWLRRAGHCCSDHIRYSITNSTVAKFKGSTLLISDSTNRLENLFHLTLFFKIFTCRHSLILFSIMILSSQSAYRQRGYFREIRQAVGHAPYSVH